MLLTFYLYAAKSDFNYLFFTYVKILASMDAKPMKYAELVNVRGKFAYFFITGAMAEKGEFRSP